MTPFLQVRGMKAECPNCRTPHRADPLTIPERGAHARCSVCRGIFGVRVTPEGVHAFEVHRPTQRAGAADPEVKARRLARALVSDMVVYHPERRARSLLKGTLREEFRDEIRRSWQEYVDQIGPATAAGTSHFRDALNEILAGGEKVF